MQLLVEGGMESSLKIELPNGLTMVAWLPGETLFSLAARHHFLWGHPPHKCAAKGIFRVQKMRYELFLERHVFIGEGERVNRSSEGQFLCLCCARNTRQAVGAQEFNDPTSTIPLYGQRHALWSMPRQLGAASYRGEHVGISPCVNHHES